MHNDRRTFLSTTGAASAASFLNLNPRAIGASEKITLALIGGRNQGRLVAGEGKAAADDSAEIASGSANRAIMAYLGDPVPVPASLDPKYNAKNLASAFTTLSQKAGLRVQKLAVDDSEFPFLVGVICANRDDMEKLKQEIRKLPDYNYTGGFGGNNSYAMNLVHYRAFPKGAAERIHRRMSLREQILFERMHRHQ